MDHARPPLDLTAPETMRFVEEMRMHGCGFIVPIDDEHYAAIMPFFYTIAIIKGRWHDYSSIEDRWCYRDRETAMVAMIDWFLECPMSPEPQGWTRHPISGRRRPDGDASKEYVNP